MVHRSAAVILFVFTCSAFIACSTSQTDSIAAEDAGSGDAAVADASQPDEDLDATPDASLATCTEVAQQGSPVAVFTTQSPVPAATGGAITDGTWVLTEAKVWGSPDPEGSSPGAAAAQTWVIKGSTLDIISTRAAGKAVTRSSGTITPAATKVTLKQTCVYPSDAGLDTDTTPFTATPSALTLYTPNGLATFALTYTKR